MPENSNSPDASQDVPAGSPGDIDVGTEVEMSEADAKGRPLLKRVLVIMGVAVLM